MCNILKVLYNWKVCAYYTYYCGSLFITIMLSNMYIKHIIGYFELHMYVIYTCICIMYVSIILAFYISLISQNFTFKWTMSRCMYSRVKNIYGNCSKIVRCI